MNNCNERCLRPTSASWTAVLDISTQSSHTQPAVHPHSAEPVLTARLIISYTAPSQAVHLTGPQEILQQHPTAATSKAHSNSVHRWLLHVLQLLITAYIQDRDLDAVAGLADTAAWVQHGTPQPHPIAAAIDTSPPAACTAAAVYCLSTK